MATPERVLVIGGTRGTGLLIVGRLRERGYRVRVLARDPDRASARLGVDTGAGAGTALEVRRGDITRPETLGPAIEDVQQIVFTAGVQSGKIASEAVVRATDYQGVIDTLAAAERAGFGGRFEYLNSIGIMTPSIPGRLLNFLKGNTLVWRRRVEEALRASRLDYTIIRVGFLMNGAPSGRALDIGQRNLPLSGRYRISRADAAEVFVEALTHPRASRTTFDAVWGRGDRVEPLSASLNRLEPDR